MDRRKFLRNLAVGGAAVAVAPTVLAACSSDSSSGAASSAAADPSSSGSSGGGGGAGKKIAFSHPFSTAPVAIAVMNFAKERGGQLGYEVLLDNANLQVQVQVTDLDNWVSQGVDAICVCPVEPESVIGSQTRAQEAGILWTTYAVEMDGTDGAVLFPHEVSGDVTGKAAVAWIKEQAAPPKVLILSQSATPAARPRTEIPKTMITEQTGATIVAEQDASDQTTGLSVTETVLQAHPDLRMVVAFNDDGALGALQAFKNAGIPVEEAWIAGQDGSIEALEAIKEGTHYKMSAALPLKEIGYAVVDINDALLNGKPAPQIASIDPVLADVDHMDVVDELIASYPK